MKEIYFPEEKEKIDFSRVDEEGPIFVKLKGKLRGMVCMNEREEWVVRIGKDLGAYGCFASLEGLIRDGIERGYTFHVGAD
jgi:hypothetical protein